MNSDIFEAMGLRRVEVPSVQHWINLGALAMACKGYEPKRGMWGWRLGPDDIMRAIERIGPDVFIGHTMWTGMEIHTTAADFTPDLRDPGTLGHCLAMMRSALGPDTWRWPEPFTRSTGELHWRVRSADGVDVVTCPTEADAVVAAWGAA